MFEKTVRAIDSSAVVKFVNHEPDWERVVEILEAGCVSLELALVESGNSLCKRVQRREMEANRAADLYEDLVLRRPFQLADQAPLYAPAMKIALKVRLPFCDALFIALAKESESELVTSDKGQADAAKVVGVKAHLIE